MAKVALLTFDAKGNFKTKLIEATDVHTSIEKPGTYAVVNLITVEKPKKEDTTGTDQPE